MFHKTVLDEVIVNKLHRKKVVGRWSADHLPTTYQPSVPTTYRPPTDHLPTDHLPTDHLLTDHLPTIYWPPTDHLPTTFLRCSLLTITSYMCLNYTNHFFWGATCSCGWSVSAQPISIRKAQSRKMPTNLCTPCEFLIKDVCSVWHSYNLVILTIE